MDLSLNSTFADRQVEKIDPLLHWVETEFGFKPVVYSSFFGGKQEDGLVTVIENLLKKTDDCELATIDAIAASAHSLIIAIGMVQGKLQIEEAIELIRLEEDSQVLTYVTISIIYNPNHKLLSLYNMCLNTEVQDIICEIKLS